VQQLQAALARADSELQVHRCACRVHVRAASASGGHQWKAAAACSCVLAD
jgi:hypothetical protein